MFELRHFPPFTELKTFSDPAQTHVHSSKFKSDTKENTTWNVFHDFATTWTLVLERLARTCVNYCKTKRFQKSSSLLLYCKSNPLRFVSGKQSLAFIMFSYEGSTAWKVSKYGVFPGPHFPLFELNTEIYSKFNPNTGKYGPEKTTYLNTSHTVQVLIFKFR